MTQTVEKNPSSSGLSNVAAAITIIACLVFGWVIWNFLLGNPSNFQNNDPSGEPIPGSLMGMMYKGGYVIAVLIGLLTTTIVFGIERWIVVSKAAGSGDVKGYVAKVQSLVNANQIDDAIELSDKQKGSVANVVKAALIKLKEVKNEGFDADKATETIQKEIEEATVLEMPMLEKNMIILATLVSIGTLVGLLGTVTGMIKAFSALSTAGSPDSAALATGISEALMNTATGIGTSTLAIVFYNIFTTKIDKLTHFIDEAGFAITQSYRRHNK
ncbi:MotA/TolQ/ExbB proton channel family protein [Flavobacterium dauae]|uniref:MotA/TolQ/ExbB proton channel family protein n=1 Tax=Flavobacterium dauae TaxID=1563479 RepID=UPI00101B5037|nr:MotA/TolQ/ExbB proton channel family protein [Flavobacterium dauae]WLD22959.1 MotA/TolQ/ExbB proton channel family protein [Flavobacterium dauae]